MSDAPGGLTTRFRHTVQVLLCDGCCCGKTEDGHPALPFTALQQQWQTQKFWHLHLTPCYCLGPCDLSNVACVLGPGGATWFGNLETSEDYAAVLGWAAALGVGAEQDPPHHLSGKRFERLASPQ